MKKKEGSTNKHNAQKGKDRDMKEPNLQHRSEIYLKEQKRKNGEEGDKRSG